MDIQLTADTFAQHLHSSFVAECSVAESEPLRYEVELIEVTALPSRPKPKWGRASESPHREHPFTLVFRFPNELSLSWIRCTLSYMSGESIGNLMLNAIDEDSRGRYYEAVFN